MIAFAASAAMLLATGAVAAAAFRLGSAALTILAAYVLVAAELVFLAEVLSPGLAERNAFLVAEAVLLAAAVAVWARLGRPGWPRPTLSVRALLREDGLTGTLLVAVGISIAYAAFLVVESPPNNWDSMTYHLSRAAAWLQMDAVAYVPDAHTERQNAFPANAEILVFHTLALVGRDTLAQLPQLVAELATMLAIFASACRLGFAPRAALFAALVFATFSVVALQSVTTQNDLVVTSFVLCAVAFVLDRNDRALPLAGLALGLAVGTKLTLAYAAPVLALLFAVVLSRRRLAWLALWSAAGFALVGAHRFVLNVIETGRVLGSESAYAPHEADSPLDAFDTAWRIGRDFVERDLLDARQGNEDLAYFGALGPLLLFPVAAVILVRWALRREAHARAVLAASIPAFALVLGAFYAYNPWIGRFMILPVALTAPLLAAVRPHVVVATAAAAIGVMNLALVHGFNHAKPVGLGGRVAVWDMPRNEAQSLHRPEMAAVISEYERLTPPDATIGAVLGGDDWSYFLYGERFERTVGYLPLDQPFAVPAGGRVVFAPGLAPAAAPAGWTLTPLGAPGWVMAERSG